MMINSKTIDLAIAAVADGCLEEDMREFLSFDPAHSEVGRKTEKKILKNIRRIYTGKNMTWISAQSFFGKAAIFVLIVFGAIFGLMMTSEAFRNSFSEFWEKFYDDHIGIIIERGDSIRNSTLFELKYVPDGWTAEVIEVNDYARMVNFIIEDDKGVYITQKSNNGGESVFIDDDYESSEKIDVYEDIEGQLYRYPDEIILIYADNGYIYIVTSDVEIETVLEILRKNR